MSASRLLAPLCLVLLLSACVSASSNPDARQTAADAPQPRPIGGDRDAHGCLTPAGYAWCAREQACVRPWELAKDKGFDNSAGGFDAWCSAKPAATP